MSRFLSASGIDLTGRDTDPGHAAGWASLRQAADASTASSLVGTDARAPLSGWGHAYYCPDHGVGLSFDEGSPTRHQCEPFDHELSGESYDAGWATMRNARLQTHLADSALAAAITGAPADLERAIELLTGLAEVYPDLELHGTAVGQGKLYAQSLEEAMLACSLARSHALVADRMTETQRTSVVDRLLAPMARLVADQLLVRTHNIEVWHLAGLASLAVVLDDHELARSTLESEHGIRSQIAEGMRPDGWWLEGNPGYHFFMITALLHAVEAHRAMGIGEDSVAVLERLLLTPLRTARNDLTVPAFNDGWLAPAVPPGLATYAGLFFRGARLADSAAVSDFLASPAAERFDRSGADHLVYGQPGRPPGDEGRIERLDVWPDSGYAILRAPGAAAGGPDTCVFVKYGPHGGGHGHPDKLELELMVQGNRVIADPGSEAYTVPIHGSWYRQTWSHPTVVIDQTSQPPATGRLLEHRPATPQRPGVIDVVVEFGGEQPDRGVAVLREPVDPDSADTYAGVRIRRTVTVVPAELDPDGGHLVDVVEVTADDDHVIDLITHVRGERTGAPGEPAAGAVTMPHLDDVAEVDASGVTAYRLTDGGEWARAHTGAELVLQATSPSNPVHQRCATTIQRVHGRSARFVAALPLTTGAHDGLAVAVEDDVVVVTRPGGVHRSALPPIPDRVSMD